MGILNLESITKVIKRPLIFFPIVTILVLWPLSLGIYSLKNDILTYYYPVRILASDAINTNSLPLWTPYINMGYPLHGDLQSSAWNPVIWLFSLLTNYSLYGFHLEVLFYFCLAGIGFYFLCKDIGVGTLGALSLGLVYEFSGPLLDNVQFFTVFTSSCYLPFVLLFFRRTMINLKFKDAAWTGFFLYLLITGGYPSIFIGTFYLLLAYYIYFLFREKFDSKRLFKYLLAALYISAVFLLLSLPAIASFTEMIKHIGRGKEQKLSFIFENSTTILSLFSFISPFSTTSEMAGLESNVLMRSVYIGLIPLIILVEGILNKRIKYSSEIKFLLIAAIVFLLFSLGDNFVVRELAYYTLPFMKYFRHPATFRLFTTFLLLTVVAWHLTLKNETARNYNLIRNIVITVFIILVSALILTSKFDSKYSVVEFVLLFPKLGLKDITFFQKLLLQTPAIVVMLLLTLYTFKHRTRFKLIFYISMLDIILATQFILPVTVIGAKKMSIIEEYVKTPIERYPPEKLLSINENSKNSLDKTKTIGSSMVYQKHIGRNSYFITPGNLTSQNTFYKSEVRKIVFEFPVVYFADTIVTELPSSVTHNSKKIAFVENLPNDFKNLPFEGSTGNLQVAANMFWLNVSAKRMSILILQQNFYPGWHAYVDEKETPIFKANMAFMAIDIPAGDHTIKFCYKPKLIYELWIISSTLLMALAIFLFIDIFLTQRKKRNAKRQ
jgi:hypothetical protein